MLALLVPAPTSAPASSSSDPEPVVGEQPGDRGTDHTGADDGDVVASADAGLAASDALTGAMQCGLPPASPPGDCRRSSASSALIAARRPPAACHGGHARSELGCRRRDDRTGRAGRRRRRRARWRAATGRPRPAPAGGRPAPGAGCASGSDHRRRAAAASGDPRSAPMRPGPARPPGRRCPSIAARTRWARSVPSDKPVSAPRALRCPERGAQPGQPGNERDARPRRGPSRRGDRDRPAPSMTPSAPARRPRRRR